MADNLHTYAAMAHKGKMNGKTFEVKATNLLEAKEKAAQIAGLKKTWDVSVQLQVRADGSEVENGYIC